MKYLYLKILVPAALSFSLLSDVKAQSNGKLSLSMVIDTLALDAPAARIQHLNYENDLLQFDNYKKGFLPSVSVSMSPLSFNRSIVKLQQATDGQYNYVEDYSSSSSAGLSIQQKVPFTGGTLSANTNLNYLNELSRNRHSFSSTPFSVRYSQQLFGDRKTMRMEKTIEYKRNEENVKKYIAAISAIQQKTLGLYMNAFLASLEKSLASSNRLATDSLLRLAKVRNENRRITEIDFKQIELQAANNEYLEENALKNFEDAVRNLISYLGIDIATIPLVTVDVPAFTLPVRLSPEMVRYYIYENNPTLLNREIRRLEAEKALYASEIQRRFNANINMSYGMNQFAQNLLDVYSSPSRQQAVSVGFTIPFSLWGVNRNLAKIAKNNYQSNLISINSEFDEFENEIERTVNNYNHTINLRLIAERAYLLA